MIDITYTISEAEYAEAQKLWCSSELRKLPGRNLLLAIAILFGVLVGWSLHYLPIGLALSIYVLLIAYWLAFRWRKRAVIQYQYKLNEDRREQAHVQIDQQGYRDEKPGRSGTWIAWASFTGWRETPRIFVLGRNLAYITVPKSLLTIEQQEQLRTLAQTRITTH